MTSSDASRYGGIDSSIRFSDRLGKEKLRRRPGSPPSPAGVQSREEVFETVVSSTWLVI